MPHTIQERVNRWSVDEGEDALQFNALYSHIEFMSRYRYTDYLPTKGRKEFLLRFRDWLDQVQEEGAQKTLFRLVPEIQFIDMDEFYSLSRTALSGPIARWLIDIEDIDIAAGDAQARLRDAVSRTWFCALTDSMDISGFYHANRIVGCSYRPDWCSLNSLKTEARALSQFMQNRGLTHLVLLEDFVGSGNQMRGALKLAQELPPPIQVLVVPLLCGTEGLSQGLLWSQLDTSRLAFEPVCVLDEQSVVAGYSGSNSTLIQAADLARSTYAQVCGGVVSQPNVAPYGPFGYEGTGSLVVMFSNTPDNTLPLIHHSSSQWSPLFPRSARVL